MKTEYILTAGEKYELAAIDQQIAILLKRKADIYANAALKCITETPEEFEAAQWMAKFLDGIKPVQVEGIAKIVTDGE